MATRRSPVRNRRRPIPTRFLHVLLSKDTRAPHAYYETERDALAAWKVLAQPSAKHPQGREFVMHKVKA